MVFINTFVYRINIFLVLLYFLLQCFSLKKECKQRPNYQQLLAHPFLIKYEAMEVDVAQFVTTVLDNHAQKAAS